MPPEMQHYHEDDPAEALQAHRMRAQLYLAEILGIGEEKIIGWIKDNGQKFADLVDKDPAMLAKLTERDLTAEEVSALRDEFLSDKIDTDAEDHDDESFDRAA